MKNKMIAVVAHLHAERRLINARNGESCVIISSTNLFPRVTSMMQTRRVMANKKINSIENNMRVIKLRFCSMPYAVLKASERARADFEEEKTARITPNESKLMPFFEFIYSRY